MANKTIYKINVINWDKYNRNLKKGHKAILISTGFLSDAKIRVLPNSGKLLYLGLLLRCGEVTSSFIEASHDHLVTFAGGSGQVVSRLLFQLEQLQLVTVEKIEPFINRIEKKRKEENINTVVVELKNEEVKKPEVQNSTQSFDDQFKFSDWVKFLQSLEMATPYVTRNIRAIASSFGEKEKLEEFLVSLAESKNFKTMNKTQARRYAVSAILREAGLK